MGIPDHIKMIPVRSSRFTDIGFDPENELLYVIFKRGAMGQYDRFKKSKWEDLLKQPSMGSWFQQEVINKPNTHKYSKL